jgi:hypothetical protein
MSLGLCELIKLAAFCDSLGIEVLDFARESAPDTQQPFERSLTCEMVGRQRVYSATINAGGFLSLSASNADVLASLESILHRVPADDWKVIARIISALEYSEVASLAERPLEIVDRYGETWVIA